MYIRNVFEQTVTVHSTHTLQFKVVHTLECINWPQTKENCTKFTISSKIKISVISLIFNFHSTKTLKWLFKGLRWSKINLMTNITNILNEYPCFLQFSDLQHNCILDFTGFSPTFLGIGHFLNTIAWKGYLVKKLCRSSSLL